jgi:hypothetical protein
MWRRAHGCRRSYAILATLGWIKADLAELLLIAHSYDKSIRQSCKTIEMAPNFALAHNQLGQAAGLRSPPLSTQFQELVRRIGLSY